MIKEITHRKTQTRAGNARLISELNKVKVTNLVRDNDGISRADLAKRSGLSAPSISRIIDGLIREGLVTEIGAGVSHGGRRPTLLKFSGIDSFIIGIDLGTTNIYGVLTDLEANVIAEIRTPTRVEGGGTPSSRRCPTIGTGPRCGPSCSAAPARRNTRTTPAAGITR